MAMTNAQIILEESVRLMKEGIIKGTGRKFETKVIVIKEDGTEVEETRIFEEPEPIHTFGAWKEMGYSVKKGEHAKASFMIWKYAEKKRNDEDDGERIEGRCFMKRAHFFTSDQVEKSPA